MYGDIGKMIISVSLFCALVGGTAGFFIGRYFIPVSDNIMKESYYRGIYDICHTTAGIPSEECLGMVSKAVSSDWYGTESDGWKWSNGN